MLSISVRRIRDDLGVIEANLGEISRIERIHAARFFGRPRSGVVGRPTPIRRADVPPLVPIRIVVQTDELDDLHVEIDLLAGFADAGFAAVSPCSTTPPGNTQYPSYGD